MVLRKDSKEKMDEKKVNILKSITILGAVSLMGHNSSCFLSGHEIGGYFLGNYRMPNSGESVLETL